MGLTNNGNEELNMGDAATLSDFIDFVKNNYQAEYYSLIMFDHGESWHGVCWDITDNDRLSMIDLKEGFKDKNLSLIGFDACLMGMVEVMCQIKDCAEIMAASQEQYGGSI